VFCECSASLPFVPAYVNNQKLQIPDLFLPLLPFPSFISSINRSSFLSKLLFFLPFFFLYLFFYFKTMASFKIQHQGELRRLTINNNNTNNNTNNSTTESWSAFKQRISELVSLSPKSFTVKYTDGDGDLITISTDHELAELLALQQQQQQQKSASAIRLQIFLVAESSTPSTESPTPSSTAIPSREELVNEEDDDDDEEEKEEAGSTVSAEEKGKGKSDNTTATATATVSPSHSHLLSRPSCRGSRELISASRRSLRSTRRSRRSWRPSRSCLGTTPSTSSGNITSTSRN